MAQAWLLSYLAESTLLIGQTSWVRSSKSPKLQHSPILCHTLYFNPGSTWVLWERKWARDSYASIATGAYQIPSIVACTEWGGQ